MHLLAERRSRLALVLRPLARAMPRLLLSRLALLLPAQERLALMAGTVCSIWARRQPLVGVRLSRCVVRGDVISWVSI